VTGAVTAAPTPVVLLAHGSPDPRSGEAVRVAAGRISALRGAPVSTAFLDHDEPRLASLDLAPGSAVLPLLLSSAYHAKVDVPAAVAALRAPVDLLAPLGHPADVLDAVIDDAGTADVVVVAAGTSDRDEHEVFATAVHEAGLRRTVVAHWAFATGPGPRLADVAPAGTTVVPWLLAPGRLLDTVHAQAEEHGSPVSGGALLAHPALLAHVVARLGG
jgi:sirohydrochlorin ferrochelatase